MDPRVELITRVVADQKAAGRLSAKEAGSLLGLCEGHFLRLFKHEVGITFRRYKRLARIAGIATLLTDNILPVKQIAGVALAGL